MEYIYLDNSATTKPSEASLEKMREALSVTYGNPSSVHAVGNASKKLMDEARRQIIASMGIRKIPDWELIFTSGGTEANNLAIFGTVYAKNRTDKGGSKGKIFVSDGEHSSVDACANRLEGDGFTVLRVPTTGGKLDLNFIRENADANTILASLMLVNNETGAIYDVKSAFDIIKSVSKNAVCHTDAVQGYLKTKFTPASLGCDAISISAHKIYSPKGAGALLVKREMIVTKRIIPIMLGGGQENNFRSGTENVPAIAAFGAAAADGAGKFEERYAHISALREKIISGVENSGIRINAPENGVPNIINMTLPGIRSEIMLNFLSGLGICISAGSACSTHSSGPSRALLAYGIPRNEADTSVRVSLGYENTEAEADEFLRNLLRGTKALARR